MPVLSKLGSKTGDVDINHTVKNHNFLSHIRSMSSAREKHAPCAVSATTGSQTPSAAFSQSGRQLPHIFVLIDTQSPLDTTSPDSVSTARPRAALGTPQHSLDTGKGHSLSSTAWICSRPLPFQDPEIISSSESLAVQKNNRHTRCRFLFLSMAASCIATYAVHHDVKQNQRIIRQFKRKGLLRATCRINVITLLFKVLNLSTSQRVSSSSTTNILAIVANQLLFVSIWRISFTASIYCAIPCDTSLAAFIASTTVCGRCTTSPPANTPLRGSHTVRIILREHISLPVHFYTLGGRHNPVGRAGTDGNEHTFKIFRNLALGGRQPYRLQDATAVADKLKELA